MELSENEIATIIVDAAYHIHQELGPGLLESVYQSVLARELRKRGLQVQEDVPVPINFEGITIDTASRADMMVNDKVIIELKSVEQLLPVHKKQLLSYLKLAEKKNWDY